MKAVTVVMLALKAVSLLLFDQILDHLNVEFGAALVLNKPLFRSVKREQKNVLLTHYVELDALFQESLSSFHETHSHGFFVFNFL